MHETEKWKWSCSVVSDSLRPHGLQPTRLLWPWNSPGKSTGIDYHCLLHKENLVLNNWCFWTAVLEKTLESPLDCKEIQPVHPEDQSRVFIGRTDVEAETPILWPPDAKSWLIRKDPDAGKDWGLEEKGTTEDEMVGWHHWLNGHGFGWTLGVGDGQGGLVHCVWFMESWLSDWTELRYFWFRFFIMILLFHMVGFTKCLLVSCWPLIYRRIISAGEAARLGSLDAQICSPAA